MSTPQESDLTLQADAHAARQRHQAYLQREERREKRNTFFRRLLPYAASALALATGLIPVHWYDTHKARKAQDELEQRLAVAEDRRNSLQSRYDFATQNDHKHIVELANENEQLKKEAEHLRKTEQDARRRLDRQQWESRLALKKKTLENLLSKEYNGNIAVTSLDEEGYIDTLPPHAGWYDTKITAKLDGATVTYETMQRTGQDELSHTLTLALGTGKDSVTLHKQWSAKPFTDDTFPRSFNDLDITSISYNGKTVARRMQQFRVKPAVEWEVLPEYTKQQDGSTRPCTYSPEESARIVREARAWAAEQLTRKLDLKPFFTAIRRVPYQD